MGIIQGGDIYDSLRAAGVLRAPDARVFLVDPTDSGFTLQNAIDECVAGNGDVIAVLPGTHTVTEPVLFNKAGISVVAVAAGLGPAAGGEFFALLSDAAYTDGPVAKISERCLIDGLGFVSRDTGTTFFSGAALLIGGDGDANPFGVHLRRCRFPKWAVDNRIGVALEGTTDCMIEECTFEGVGTDFEAGIYIQGAMQNLIMRRNYFRQCTAAVKCGAFAGGGPHIFLHENFVEDGKLLDTDGNTGNGLIAGNWLETATGTASYDRAVATLQGDGWQFSDNHYSE